MQRAPLTKGYAPRISLFFAGYFFPFGIYIPFFGVWLKSIGMTSEEIGLVLTIPLVIRVFFTPVMSALADKVGDRRLTLRIYCLFYAAGFALITLNDSLLWIGLIMALSHIAQSAIVPVADSLAMAGTRRYDLDYGKMRSWGSMAFVVANLVGGLILNEFGASRIIWLLVFGNLLHVLFSLSLPVDPRLIDNKRLAKGTQLNRHQLKQFAQGGFLLILVAAGLLQASHGMLYAFATIYWQKIGIAANMTGIFWSVSVLAEVVVFIYSKRILKRVGWRILLLLGGLSGILRWCLFPLALPEIGYILLQLLHAGSFGCTHLGTMFFISENVDDDLSGTAQGLFTTASGLLLAGVTYLSGLLYARWEGMSFLTMSVTSTAALLLILISTQVPMKQVKANSKGTT